MLWEAGLIIEVPPGALIYYPSSLFTHFNVDITGRILSNATACQQISDISLQIYNSSQLLMAHCLRGRMHAH